MNQAQIRVVGYARVSTDEQATTGVSLDAQREKIGAYARLYEHELIRVVADPGASAKSLDRPGLAEVLGMLDDGQAAGVIVTKLDRLTRSVGDLATLLDRYFGERPGKLLFSVGDSIDTRNAAGRLVLNVLMSVSQWERETVVERTRSAVEFKRGRGERLGTVPYGKVLGPDGRTLVACDREASAIVEARRLAGEGLSLRGIASALDRFGVPPKSGRGWSASTVRGIIGRRGPEGAGAAEAEPLNRPVEIEAPRRPPDDQLAARTPEVPEGPRQPAHRHGPRSVPQHGDPQA